MAFVARRLFFLLSFHLIFLVSARNCKSNHAQVFISLDKSGSMNHVDSGVSRWQKATDAIKNILTNSTFTDQIDFGFQFFGGPCNHIDPVISIGPGKATQIVNTITNTVVISNTLTPMGEHIHEVDVYLKQHVRDENHGDASRTVHLLVGDGIPYVTCMQEDTRNCLYPDRCISGAVDHLYTKSYVKSYIVGFGDTIKNSADFMDKLAVAGRGTDKAFLTSDTAGLESVFVQLLADICGCGDGLVTYGEECDDGNDQNDDGCSSQCVIERPKAVADDVSMLEDAPPVVFDVIANDLTYDGSPFTVGVMSSFRIVPSVLMSHGVASVFANGSILYTLQDQDWFGVDYVEYEICMAFGAVHHCDQAFLTIHVHSFKDPPILVNDSMDAVEDTPATIDVLKNDIDLDHSIDRGTLTVESPPSHGTTEVNAQYNIVYTPNYNFHGDDSLVYNVCDEDAVCYHATLFIHVKSMADKLSALPIYHTAVLEEHNALFHTLQEINYDSETTVYPSNITVFGLSNVDASDGALSLSNTTGDLLFEPTDHFCGNIQIPFQVCSIENMCTTTAVWNVTVQCVNDRPIITDLSSTTSMTSDDLKSGLTINMFGSNVFFDEEDSPDLASLLILDPPPSLGEVRLPDLVFSPELLGYLEYNPYAGQTGHDEVNYRVCDTGGLCADGTWSIDVVDDQGPLVSMTGICMDETRSVKVSIIFSESVTHFDATLLSTGECINTNITESLGSNTYDTFFNLTESFRCNLELHTGRVQDSVGNPNSLKRFSLTCVEPPQEDLLDPVVAALAATGSLLGVIIGTVVLWRVHRYRMKYKKTNAQFKVRKEELEDEVICQETGAIGKFEQDANTIRNPLHTEARASTFQQRQILDKMDNVRQDMARADAQLQLADVEMDHGDDVSGFAFRRNEMTHNAEKRRM